MTALGRKIPFSSVLNKAYEERSAALIYLKVCPTLDGLRSDPRFEELLRRMNFQYPSHALAGAGLADCHASVLQLWAKISPRVQQSKCLEDAAQELATGGAYAVP